MGRYSGYRLSNLRTIIDPTARRITVIRIKMVVDAAPVAGSDPCTVDCVGFSPGGEIGSLGVGGVPVSTLVVVVEASGANVVVVTFCSIVVVVVVSHGSSG